MSWLWVRCLYWCLLVMIMICVLIYRYVCLIIWFGLIWLMMGMVVCNLLGEVWLCFMM